MYNYSVEIPDGLAPSFTEKLEACDKLRILKLELGDTIDGVPISELGGERLEELRGQLISSGVCLSLVTVGLHGAEPAEFKKLLRAAHLLSVESIKLRAEPSQTMERLTAAAITAARLAGSYGISVLVENAPDTVLKDDAGLSSLVCAVTDPPIGTIFNPLGYVYTESHPFFHMFYASKLKNNIRFLRVNDGLYKERKPVEIGCGNAEIKEMASILLSRSYNGYFSFVPYLQNMELEDYSRCIRRFRDILKAM